MTYPVSKTFRTLLSFYFNEKVLGASHLHECICFHLKSIALEFGGAHVVESMAVHCVCATCTSICFH